MIAAITVVMIAASIPGAAQQRSNSSHVILIARMPETLTFVVNHGNLPGSIPDAGQQETKQIARSVSASWVLGKGRSRIVTWAHVTRPQLPVLLAFAASDASGIYGGRAGVSDAGFHLSMQPQSSSSRLDSLALTGINLAGSNTLSLSDSMDPAPTAELPEEDYNGTIKIQVQTLP